MRRMLDYDTLADDYARHRGVHPGVSHGLVSSGLGASSRVLEVGCGTGNYVDAISRAVGCTCSGIDPSERMLAIARERGVLASLVDGDAERLPFASGSFELVFSVDVIHHVTDKAASYREAYRVLGAGGRICTVTDSEDIIRRRQPLSVYFPETVEVELARVPRIEDLRQMMAAAGLGAIGETVVEATSEIRDVSAYRDKAHSSLHLISPDAFARGIRRMEDDLRSGPISCVSRYTMLWGTR